MRGMHSVPGAARLAAVVLVVLLLLCLCCSTCQAQQRRFNFKTPGSAKAALGVTRLARIKARSGQGHLSIDQLAKCIEDDDDLVGGQRPKAVLGHLGCWLHAA